jgi:hypothetical protein
MPTTTKLYVRRTEIRGRPPASARARARCREVRAPLREHDARADRDGGDAVRVRDARRRGVRHAREFRLEVPSGFKRVLGPGSRGRRGLRQERWVPRRQRARPREPRGRVETPLDSPDASDRTLTSSRYNKFSHTDILQRQRFRHEQRSVLPRDDLGFHATDRGLHVRVEQPVAEDERRPSG